MSIKSNETIGSRRSRSVRKSWKPTPNPSRGTRTALTNNSTPLGEAPPSQGRQSPRKNEEDESTAAEKLVLEGIDSAENDRRQEAEIGRQDSTRL